MVLSMRKVITRCYTHAAVDIRGCMEGPAAEPRQSGTKRGEESNYRKLKRLDSTFLFRSDEETGAGRFPWLVAGFESCSGRFCGIKRHKKQKARDRRDNGGADYAGRESAAHDWPWLGSESEPVIGARSKFFNIRLVSGTPRKCNEEGARDDRHEEKPPVLRPHGD